MVFGAVDRNGIKQQFVAENLYPVVSTCRDLYIEVIGTAPFLNGRSVGHGECCRRVAGNLHMPEEASARLLPTGNNPSVRRTIGDVEPRQFVEAESRSQTERLPSGRGALQAAQTFIKPREEIAQQHDMIGRIHGRIGCVSIPQFPDSSSSPPDHITPGRIGILNGQHIGNIVTPPVGEFTHEPLNSNNATAQMSGIDPSQRTVPVHLLEQNLCINLAGDILFDTVGHHIESQRQEVSRNRIVVVEDAVRIEHVFRLVGSSATDMQILAVESFE